MAGSSKPGANTNPWALSATTGGPMGTNFDAADPRTPPWFKGDTVGTTGINDHADPNEKMCRDRPLLERYLPSSRLGNAAESWLATTCRKVWHELDEATKIRDAFADPELLKRAEAMGLDGQGYTDMISNYVFPRERNPQDSGSYSVPMYTDPLTCQIRKNWDLVEYRRREIPDVIYEADLKHEELHAQHCNEYGERSREYIVAMSFPAKRSKEEVAAYNVKIEHLRGWFDRNCALCRARSDAGSDRYRR